MFGFLHWRYYCSHWRYSEKITWLPSKKVVYSLPLLATIIICGFTVLQDAFVPNQPMLENHPNKFKLTVCHT
jgi:hypothetical protein